MVKNKKRMKQASLFPIPKEIEKIANMLDITGLGFCQHNLKELGHCVYCLEGVIGKNAGISDVEMEDESYLTDLGIHNAIRDQYLKQIIDFCGFDISKEYSNTIYCPLSCSIDAQDPDYTQLITPERVFIHLNDKHNKSKTHKENADLIREFSRYYNIITGEEVIKE